MDTTRTAGSKFEYLSPLLDRTAREVFRSARSWQELVAGFRDVQLKDEQLIT